jgi:hypothetical protein
MGSDAVPKSMADYPVLQKRWPENIKFLFLEFV